jgi:hypothetical protein
MRIDWCPRWGLDENTIRQRKSTQEQKLKQKCMANYHNWNVLVVRNNYVVYMELPGSWESKTWLWVPWNSEPRMTVLARTSSKLPDLTQPMKKKHKYKNTITRNNLLSCVNSTVYHNFYSYFGIPKIVNFTHLHTHETFCQSYAMVMTENKHHNP